MIHIEQLTKFYNGFCAVDRISLDIREGEVLGLLGPNGAGKTTTLRMLTGYFRPTSGTIRVKDYSMADHLREIKSLIGYLPESAPLYHSMLVYDYLDYVARIRGLDSARREARIRELVATCDIGGIMHKPIAELSKGLKQRVGLAHAMMEDPEILILDEPTSGLDPNQIVEIRGIIRRIGKEKTVILSTHILSEAEATCDRIIIINKGRIIADGSAEELKQSGTQRGCLYLTLADADDADVLKRLGALDGVERITTAEAETADTMRFEITGPTGIAFRSTLYREIKQTDWVLLEFQQESQDLESTFRELTRET